MAENIFKLSYTAAEIDAKLGKIPDNWNAVADQTYNANSTNAQSGKAVASGISQAINEAKDPIIASAVNDAVTKVQDTIIPNVSNNAINKAVNQAVEKVNNDIVPSVLATAEATIQAKIEEESIPKAKQEVLNDAKNLFANAIRGTKEGTYVLIDDATVVGQDMGVRVINNSKNLIHAKMTTEVILDIYRGVKLDPKAFPYTLSISLKKDKDIANLPSDLYFGIAYKNTGEARSALWIVEHGAYKTPEKLYRNTESLRAFNLDEIAVAVYADSNIDNAWSTIFEYFDVQLEHSLEPTSYQQAVHFPDVKVTVCGKNIFDTPEVRPPVSASDEYHKITANLTSNIIISAEKSDDLKFNFDTTSNTAPWRIAVAYADGTFRYCKDAEFAKESGCDFIFTASEENPITEINFRSYGITAGCYKNIQVEFGSEATDYEQYLSGGTFQADENGNVIVTTNLTSMLLHTNKPYTSLAVGYTKDTSTTIQKCVLDSLDYNNLKNKPLATHEEINRDVVSLQSIYAEKVDLIDTLEAATIPIDNILVLNSENTLHVAGPLKMLLDGIEYDIKFESDGTPFAGNKSLITLKPEDNTGEAYFLQYADEQSLIIVMPRSESGIHMINIYYQHDHAWLLPEKAYTFTRNDVLGLGIKNASYSVAQVLIGAFENYLYRISFDNDTYEFFWTRTDLFGNAEVYVSGNLGLLNPSLANTGEPFCLGYLKNQNLFVIATVSTTTDTHIISLEKVLSRKVVYDRLDDGYLAYSEDVTNKNVTFLGDVKGYNGLVSLGQLRRDLSDLNSNVDNKPTLVEGFVGVGNFQPLTKGLSANRETLPAAVGVWIESKGAHPIELVSGSRVKKPTNAANIYFDLENGSFKCTYSSAIYAKEVYDQLSNYEIVELHTDETSYRKILSCTLKDCDVIVNTISASNYPAPTHAGYLTQIKVYPKNGEYSHAEGEYTIASGYGSHAEGSNTTASGYRSHAEGYNTTASSDGSHAEGYNTTASGIYSHAEGYRTTASHGYSHAEGFETAASSDYSHAEGSNTTASGIYSHAEGYNTTASGYSSHAEGSNTTASHSYSHAEGSNTTASGYGSHAEGLETAASGNGSHASGIGTKATGDYSTVIGRYNIEDTANKYSFIIGNGVITNKIASNAHTVDWNGNAWYAGSIEAVDGIILKSTTEGSTKKFKITVDDTGVLTTTEYVEVATTEVEEIIEE